MSNSVACGSELARYFQAFSCDAQPPSTYSHGQMIGDTWDMMNQFNNCDQVVKTYHELQSIPQADLCMRVELEFGMNCASTLPLSSATQDAPKLPPALVEDSITIESPRISDLPVQKIPKETCITPDSDVNSNLPSKKHSQVRKVHSFGGIHACSSCNRSFNHRRYLILHIKSKHSGLKNERCAICGKQFHLREELEKHRLRHNAENKPITCEYCPKKFNFKCDMKRHMQAVHTGPPLSCQCCGKGFVRMDYLVDHEIRFQKNKTKAANQSMLKTE